MIEKITIFTDGSSRGNPGPGGWGAVVVRSLQCKVKNESTAIKMQDKGAISVELGGGEKNTTNNRMELEAAIQGLKKVRSDSVIPAIRRLADEIQDSTAQVTIFSDSSYVINGITKWVKGWKRNGWQTKTKEDVLNKDLWLELDGLVAEVESKTGKVHWEYVGGHVGILGNERCDHIATSFADGMKIKLYEGPLASYDLSNILDISFDQTKQTQKSANSAHSRAKAYSYVSMIQGVIETHHSWAECEKRVKGVKGARFKKALDSDGEARIIAEFEAV